MPTNPDPANSTYMGPYADPSRTNLGTPLPGFETVNTGSAKTEDLTTPNAGAQADTPAKIDPTTEAFDSRSRGVYDPVTAAGATEVATDAELELQGAQDAPENAPMAWAVEDLAINAGETRVADDKWGSKGDSIASTQHFGRDPYRNEGMIDQGFLNNPPS